MRYKKTKAFFAAVTIFGALFSQSAVAFAETATPETAAKIAYRQAIENSLAKYNFPPAVVEDTVRVSLGLNEGTASLPDSALTFTELAIRYGNVRPAKADEGNGYGSLFDYDVDADGRELESGVYYYYADTVASNHVAGFGFLASNPEQYKKDLAKGKELKAEFEAAGSPGGDFNAWYRAQVTAAKAAEAQSAETAQNEDSAQSVSALDIGVTPFETTTHSKDFSYGGALSGQPTYTVTATAGLDNSEDWYKIKSFVLTHSSVSGLTFTQGSVSIENDAKEARTTMYVTDGNGYAPTWAYRVLVTNQATGTCSFNEE